MLIISNCNSYQLRFAYVNSNVLQFKEERFDSSRFSHSTYVGC